MAQQSDNHIDSYLDYLLSTMPTNHGSVDADVCLICLEDLPQVTWRGTERTRLLCCGKFTCAECAKLLHDEKLRTVTDVRRRLEQHQFPPREDIENALKDMECPNCRTALPRNDSERLALVQKNAERDKPWAIQKLGMYNKDGVGTEKNLPAAYQYFLKAAKAGYLEAMHEVGECYRFGKGTRVNLDEAAKWYEKAAEKNFALSQYQLANIINGNSGRSSVPRDLKRAFALLQKASDQGLHYAQCDMAYAYENGLGVQPSLERSIYFNRLAAMQGNETAQANLAGNYLHAASMADGGRADRAMPIALFWARKAVEGGNQDAASLVSQIEVVATKSCSYCKARDTPASPLLKCSRCNACLYCNAEHQKAHWKVHKPSCSEVKAAAEEYDKLNGTSCS